MPVSYTIRALARSINLQSDEKLACAISCQVPYRVTSSEPVGENDVLLALRAHLTTNNLLTFLDMPLKEISVTDRHLPTEHFATASYERSLANWSSGGGDDDDPPASSVRPGEKTSANYSTSTATRMVSLGRIHSYGAMWNTPLLDLQTDSDGTLKANGVPVLVSSGTYDVTHYYKASELSDTVRHKIVQARCTVNNASWRSWGAGEVLFTGESRMRDPQSQYIEMTFHFQISLNATNIPVGPYNVDKDGWDVITVRAVPQVTATSGGYARTVAIAGAAVDRVYPRTNFSSLLPIDD